MYFFPSLIGRTEELQCTMKHLPKQVRNKADKRIKQ